MAIVLNILTLTTVLTTTNGNFFYNNCCVKHFITLNRLILIKTTKNIVISINNNAFTYSLTNNIEPSTAKHSDNKGKSTTYFYNNNNGDNNPPNLLEFIVNTNSDELVNIENLTVNINFLNCYFNDDG